MDAPRCTRFILTGLALLLLGAPARADVVMERKLSVGLLENQPRGVILKEWIRSDRLRYSTERIFQETIPGDPTGGSTLQILRFDRELQWVIHQADSSYQEIPLAELIGTLPWVEPARLGLGAPGADRDWKIHTKKTREKLVIMGMEARLFVLEAKGSQETVDGERHYELFDYVWLTGELAGRETVDSLRARLVASVGTDVSFLPIAVGLYQSFPGVTPSLLSERAELDGFPLRDSLTIRIIEPGDRKEKREKLTPLFILSVTSVSENDIADAFYEPPAGYRRKGDQ